MNDETSAQEIGMDRPAVRGGAEPRVQSFAPGETIVPAKVPVDFSSVILQGLSSRARKRGPADHGVSFGRRFLRFAHLCAEDFARQCGCHDCLRGGHSSTRPAGRIFRESYHLARLFWASTLIDASIFRQWIASIGRRSANARLAHLFCELYLRCKMVGLTKDMTYLLPATQTDLSDVLGLSLVHTNRTCAALRSEGLATFARRTVTIHDWDKLQRVAEFNPEYLHLEAKPVVGGAR
jgi:Crp-like helix-turn-helix domain